MRTQTQLGFQPMQHVHQRMVSQQQDIESALIRLPTNSDLDVTNHSALTLSITAVFYAHNLAANTVHCFLWLLEYSRAVRAVSIQSFKLL